MWAELIVVPTPDLRQHLGLLPRREDFPVEEFIPEFAVEALDVAVLPRTPRLDEQCSDFQEILSNVVDEQESASGYFRLLPSSHRR